MLEVARCRNVLFAKPSEALGFLKDGLVRFGIKGNSFGLLFLQEQVMDTLEHALSLLCTAVWG